MTESFKVIALRADDSGCGKYRIKDPAHAVTLLHPEIEVVVDTGIEVQATRNSKTKLTTVSHIDVETDVIVIQRPLNQWFTSMIAQARRQGIATVVELDDDFENLNRRNQAWENVQPSRHPESNYEWLKQACELADWVTVSTPGLARYATHGRVSVIPNYICKDDVTTGPLGVPDLRTVVGWSGVVATHPNDLQVVGSGVNQALRDTGASFKVVGDMDGVRDALRLAKAIPLTQTGWVTTDEYLELLARSIDIGLVPLEDTEFNRCKSNLKGLEYAACGIPFVASPMPEYTRLAARGIGEIATNQGEWRRAVAKLVTNVELRAGTGEAYRALVRQDWLTEDHADEWVLAWKNALNNSADPR